MSAGTPPADPAAMIVLETTVGSEADADALTAALLERRVAACVQRSAVRSTYRWEGEITTEDEILLRCKAPAAARDRLCAAIDELHPYETPEVVLVAAEAGDRYGAWLHENV